MASTYSPQQITAFFQHIDLPRKYGQANFQPRDLDFLTALHTYTISTIPYENLSLHYSQTYSISLDPQDLFRKIVLGGRSRGGYCMEVAIFFNHFLRALDFDVYAVGIKNRNRIGGVPEGPYNGWSAVLASLLRSQHIG
jgi:arylamine N-acetyltransferase